MNAYLSAPSHPKGKKCIESVFAIVSIFQDAKPPVSEWCYENCWLHNSWVAKGKWSRLNNMPDPIWKGHDARAHRSDKSLRVQIIFKKFHAVLFKVHQINWLGVLWSFVVRCARLLQFAAATASTISWGNFHRGILAPRELIERWDKMKRIASISHHF